MLEYLDGQYTVLEDTLLAVNNQDKKPNIPSKLGKCTIKRIGAGCSLNKQTIDVTIPEGVVEIGEGAFLNAQSLLRIFLPESLEKCDGFVFSENFYHRDYLNEIFLKRRLTEQDYSSLKGNSIELGNGFRLLTGAYQDLPFFKNVLSGFGGIFPPARVLPEMNAVYPQRDLSEIPEQLVFKEKGRKTVSCDNNRVFIFNREIVKLMLKETQEYIYNERSEADADRRKRENGSEYISPVMLSIYSDNETRKLEDGYHMIFHIRFARTFFYILKKVTVSGKKYYVLRESYLTSVEKEPYYYRDIVYDIYDEEGNSADLATKDWVFSKYKLLSMLT